MFESDQLDNDLKAKECRVSEIGSHKTVIVVIEEDVGFFLSETFRADSVFG